MFLILFLLVTLILWVSVIIDEYLVIRVICLFSFKFFFLKRILFKNGISNFILVDIDKGWICLKRVEGGK